MWETTKKIFRAIVTVLAVTGLVAFGVVISSLGPSSATKVVESKASLKAEVIARPVEKWVLGLANKHGIDITTAVLDKLEICRKRDWGTPDENGVIRHLPHG